MKENDIWAFPGSSEGYAPEWGMTLLDYFAAKALQAYVQVFPKEDYDVAAVDCYNYARAMLRERSR